MKFGKYLLEKSENLEKNIYIFPYKRFKNLIKQEKIESIEFKKNLLKEFNYLEEYFNISIHSTVTNLYNNSSNLPNIFQNYNDGIKYFIATIVNFAKDIYKINQNIQLNKTAFYKIIKKFDKNFKTNLLAEFLPEIYNKSIFKNLFENNPDQEFENSLITYLANYKNSYEHELLDAIDRSDISRCNYLLDKDINIDYQNYNQRTALHIAINKKNINLINKILELNPNKTIIDRDGYTVLDESIEIDSYEIYSILKSKEFKNSSEYTSKINTKLLYNTNIENLSNIKKLIDYGGNVNIADIFGNTLLHIASNKKNLDIIKLLINCNANYKIKNNADYYPFYKLMDTDNKLIIEFLKKIPNILEYINKEQIYKFVKLDNSIAVTNYISLGYNILEKSDIKYTLLSTAIFYNKPEILSYIIEIYNKNKIQWIIDDNLLYNCKSNLLLPIFKKFNIDININNKQLFESVYKNDIEILKYLIEIKKELINQVDINGDSILHIAVLLNYEKICIYLLNNKIDTDIKNKSGNYAMDYAILNNNFSILTIFKEFNIKCFDNEDKIKFYTNEFFDAAENNDLELINFFIEYGFNINCHNYTHQNALHIGVINCNIEVCILLIDNKIDCNHEDIFEKTPLEYAKLQKNNDIIQLLEKCDARLSKLTITKIEKDNLAICEKIDENMYLIEEHIKKLDPTITEIELDNLRNKNSVYYSKLKDTAKNTVDNINNQLINIKIDIFKRNLQQFNSEIIKINPEASNIILSISTSFNNLFSTIVPLQETCDPTFSNKLDICEIDPSIQNNIESTENNSDNYKSYLIMISSYSKKLCQIPLISTICQYKLSYIKNDLYAGILGGFVMIPAGIGYGILSGFEENPLIGVHSMIMPSIIYAIFGSCKHLSVGPISIVCLLINNSISALGPPSTQIYLEYNLILTFLVGSLYFLFNIFKLGDLVTFLSKPVLSGFSSATAIITIGSMLKYIFGTSYEKNVKTYITYYNFFISLDNTNIGSLIISFICFTLLFINTNIEKLKCIPGSIILVIVTILISYLSDFNNMNIPIIGDLPGGLPNFSYPDFGKHSDTLPTLIKSSFFIACIGFIESIAISKYSAHKYKYKLDMNCELNALSLCNIINSLFTSIPVMGSFSRTSFNIQNNMETQISSIISSIIIFLSLLILSPIIYYLPKSLLGVLIIKSVLSLIDLKTPRKLWLINKYDFVSLFIAFSITMILGIDWGMICAVIFSLLSFLKHCKKSPIYILGRKPGTVSYYEDNNHYKNLIFYPNILIIKLGSTLFFGNSEKFKDKIVDLINELTEYIILDFSCITTIDYTSLDNIISLLKNTDERNISVIITHITKKVYNILEKGNILEKIELKNNIHNAVKMCLNKQDTNIKSEPDVVII